MSSFLINTSGSPDSSLMLSHKRPLLNLNLSGL
nr:MAG TPA: hypothetical protein [Crassvirales sp.]